MSFNAIRENKFSRKFPNFSTFCRFQVAFNLAQMIDNGETVALRAGRTRTDFKWKGLIKYINRHLTELCLSKGAKNVVFVITDANPSAPVLFSSNLTHHLVTRVSTHDRRQSRTLLTIDERGSKIVGTSVFDCHLSPVTNGNRKLCF